MRLIERVWFQGHAAKWLLLPLLAPLTVLFYLLSGLRRLGYRTGLFKQQRVVAPVLVVGNISVGGNGKTPVVLWLIERCRELGLTPGVISRGYGGRAAHYPLLVTDSTDAAEAGDEPVMIYRRSGVAIAVGADRIASAELLQQQGCDILIADDGLQHYRLARDLELLVIDSKRLFGNGFLLPMGPLREGLWRLNEADFLIFNGDSTSELAQQHKALTMQLAPQTLVNCHSGERIAVADFCAQQQQIQAIAGIGAPQRFFTSLSELGFTLAQQRAFADHYAYRPADFQQFSAALPLLMTEKDAVKCQGFAEAHWWYLTVDAMFEPQQADKLIAKIKQLSAAGRAQ